MDGPIEASLHADLIASIAERRDSRAFDALFQHFSWRIAASLRRWKLPESQNQDLVQETMIAVWRRANTYDRARGNVSGWILSIAHHLATDEFRRASRELRAFSQVIREPRGQGDETPHDNAQAREWERLIRSALTALTPQQYDVIWLAYFEHMSHSEITRKLELPLGTVKTRVRAATAKMLDILERPTVVRSVGVR